MTFTPPFPRLRDLSDVSIGVPSGDDLLSFDQPSGKWVNAPLGSSRLGVLGTIPRPGTWSIPGWDTKRSPSGTTVFANFLVVQPLVLAGKGKIERILVQATQVPTPLQFLAAIYADNGNYYPGNLIATFPPISISAPGIYASIPSGGIALKRGLYWIGGLTTANANFFNPNGASYPHVQVGNMVTDYSVSGNWSHGSTKGFQFGTSSIPNPFPPNAPDQSDLSSIASVYLVIHWA